MTEFRHSDSRESDHLPATPGTVATLPSNIISKSATHRPAVSRTIKGRWIDAWAEATVIPYLTTRDIEEDFCLEHDLLVRAWLSWDDAWLTVGEALEFSFDAYTKEHELSKILISADEESNE